MTHDGSKGSNVGVIVEYLKTLDKTYDFYYIKKSETNKIKEKGLLADFISFFIIKPYEMATSKYILQDNIFLPIAYIHFRKKVKVVQLWHGTGTIKKFGQSVNVGKLRKLEKMANQSITHLIVNAESTRSTYSEAFGISEEKIVELGLPRTDVLFNTNRLNQDLLRFYQEYPQLKNKKVILYAPTFRDDELKDPALKLNIIELLDNLTKEYSLILKLHPFIADKFNDEGSYKEKYKDRVYNLSKYKDINILFLVADLLVTDYSSIIFDYCVLEKPMLFFAYDLEKFSESGRGFYHNYKGYVPGNIAYTTGELVKYINNEEYDRGRINDFKHEHYQYLDGCSTKRIVDYIFLHQ